MNAIKTFTAVALLAATFSAQSVILSEPAAANGGYRFEDGRGISLLPSCNRAPAKIPMISSTELEFNVDLLQVCEGAGKAWEVRRSAVGLQETDTSRWVTIQRYVEAKRGGSWYVQSEKVGELDVGRCPQLRSQFKRRG